MESKFAYCFLIFFWSMQIQLAYLMKDSICILWVNMMKQNANFIFINFSLNKNAVSYDFNESIYLNELNCEFSSFSPNFHMSWLSFFKVSFSFLVLSFKNITIVTPKTKNILLCTKNHPAALYSLQIIDQYLNSVHNSYKNDWSIWPKKFSSVCEKEFYEIQKLLKLLMVL